MEKGVFIVVFNFDDLVDRHGTYSMEYDWSDEQNAEIGIGKTPENLIALDVADMDFHCAPCIKKALQKIVLIQPVRLLYFASQHGSRIL